MTMRGLIPIYSQQDEPLHEGHHIQMLTTMTHIPFSLGKQRLVLVVGELPEAGTPLHALLEDFVALLDEHGATLASDMLGISFKPKDTQ